MLKLKYAYKNSTLIKPNFECECAIINLTNFHIFINFTYPNMIQNYNILLQLSKRRPSRTMGGPFSAG